MSVLEYKNSPQNPLVLPGGDFNSPPYSTILQPLSSKSANTSPDGWRNLPYLLVFLGVETASV
jgi:hypothetical protein